MFCYFFKLECFERWEYSTYHWDEKECTFLHTLFAYTLSLIVTVFRIVLLIGVYTTQKKQLRKQYVCEKFAWEHTTLHVSAIVVIIEIRRCLLKEFVSIVELSIAFGSHHGLICWTWDWNHIALQYAPIRFRVRFPPSLLRIASPHFYISKTNIRIRID